jgi:predicted amidophosphoribosyltransferase
MPNKSVPLSECMDYQQEHRARSYSSGLCPDCKSPLASGKKRCKACLAKGRERARKYHERRRAANRKEGR